MSAEDESLEAVTAAYRERGRRGELQASPAWHDLDDRGRVAAFEATRAMRVLEAALDPASLSTTAKAVLARIRGA